MNNQYPKTFTHCSDHNSKVVVANAEQEAQLPAEYLPAVTAGGSTISAADQATNVLLSPEYSQLLADREALAAERAEFAEHSAAERKALVGLREKLEEDRKELVDGYKAAKEKLDADLAQLAADRQALEDKRPPVQPAGDAAAPATTTDSAAPPAAAPAADTTATPAKRVRHAKAD